MKKIIIVGTGGMGRELLSWIKNDSRYNEEWIFKGFIDKLAKIDIRDDNPIHNYKVPVYSIKEYIVDEDDIFLLAIGEPNLKKIILSELAEVGIEVDTFIHSSVILGENVLIGKGSILCPNVVVSCDVTIGNYVVVNLNSTIGHDSEIRDYVTLSSHVDITGNCFVDQEVFMGSHSALVPNTKVEKNAVIAAGSIGIRKVKEGTTILGVPGKKFSIIAN